MTLEQTLAEVGPIFNKGSFPLASMQEVMTAKQFADEINSDRLSVKDTYLNFWSHIDSKITELLGKDFRMVLPDWKLVLHHLPGMLYENIACELVEVVSESYIKYKNELDFGFDEEYIDGILEDLAICAKFIGSYQSLHSNCAANHILNCLVSVACRFGGDERENIRSDVANKVLGLTKSKKVAEDLIDFIRWCGPVLDHGYPTDDARLHARSRVTKTIDEIGKSGVEIENILLKNLYSGMDMCEGFEPIVGLIGSFGGKTSLKVLMNRLLNHDVLKRLSWGEAAGFNYFVVAHQCFNHFYSIFKIIKRTGFDPELIKQFNDCITGSRSGRLIAEYHRALSSFAKDFKEVTGKDLYDHLEKNKMQFWDYWMVYK